MVQGPPRAFTLRGQRGIYGSAGSTSGVFMANSGSLFAIQNGVVGVIPLLMMANPPTNWYGEGPFANGLMINVADDIVVLVQNGTLTVAMGYDRRLVLDTRPAAQTTTEDQDDNAGDDCEDVSASDVNTLVPE